MLEQQYAICDSENKEYMGQIERMKRQIEQN